MRSSLFRLAALLSACTSAVGQPPARSLDQALVDVLSLGVAAGCGPAFGLSFPTQLELDTYLAAERDAGRLGKELAAVCGSSAVSSAAALGGSLGSPQTTKTVSQFRLARARIDSRLDPRGKRAVSEGPLLLAQLGSATGMSRTDAGVGAAEAPEGNGPGVFTHLSRDRRERATTALEAGYKATVSEALVGTDYATRDGFVAGAWAGYRSTEADYRNINLLIGGAGAGFGGTLTAATQIDICKIGPGGRFDDKGALVGGFIAKRVGEAFADVGVQFSRRDYNYQRNVCSIEGDGGAITRVALKPGESGFASGGVLIDDIYAGTISGNARVSDWSLSGRIGFDGGGEQWQWGPRLSLSYQRTSIGAFTESGRTSVTNTVKSNNEAVLTTLRTAGDPTGLELDFDRQRRTSLLSELQVVAAYRHETSFGTLVPRLSASWQHEFKGDRELVGVRMAQDRRASPTHFTFTTDSADKNKGTLSFGLSLQRGPQFAADVELTRLLGDNRFDSTQLALQARWRF